MIKLVDLIQLAGVKLDDYKIHLATLPPHRRAFEPSPLEKFHAGEFEEWQNHQTQKNFGRNQVLGLAHMGGDRWLFTGAWRVLGVGPHPVKRGFKYDTEEVPGLEHLAGRIIVEFKRTFRNSYLLGDSFGNQLLVAEVLASRSAHEPFRGYGSVRLSHSALRQIIRRRPDAWVTALSSVRGVYLVTDRSNGKVYVGSARGNQNIWGRWAEYSKSGHAGNKELVNLLAERGSDHAQHFQFSILEVSDLKGTSDEILVREEHWKNVLLAREFGYNAN